MKVEEFLDNAQCDIGGVNLGRIKYSEWQKLRNTELKFALNVLDEVKDEA